VLISVLQEPQKNQETWFYRGIVRQPKGDSFIDLEFVKNKSPLFEPHRILQFLQNSLKLTKLHLVKSISEQVEKELITIAETTTVSTMKIGILLVREGQTTQNEMFSNRENTPALKTFLDTMGDEVILEGFKGFRGGLDVRTNSTGKTSYCTQFGGIEIMYHVATHLPHMEKDEQQLEKKRHLGNDIVVIVFNESSLQFNCEMISSHFIQICAVVTPPSETEPKYKVEFSEKPGIPTFGQSRESVLLDQSEIRRTLLTTLLNGERAACAGPAFFHKIKHVRQQMLAEISTKLTAV